MPEPDLDHLRTELRRALALEGAAERMLAVVAVVAELLADLGLRPVVVGGLAASYWSHQDEYATDIDVLLPHDERVDERLRELGFGRTGRHWVLRDDGVLLEAPARTSTRMSAPSTCRRRSGSWCPSSPSRTW